MNQQDPMAQSHRLLWEGLPQPRKGPRPALSLGQIISTAIRLADAEGVDALSMRKLAAELQMSPMALYRYVPSKRVLLDVMLDAISAPPEQDLPQPDESWRAGLERIARGARRMYLDHPWLMHLNWTRPVLGPNSLAGVEVVMSTLAASPFDDREKMMVLTAVDSYVVGITRQEILLAAAAEESGLSDEDFWTLQLPVLEAAMISGDYPAMAAMAEDTFAAGWDESFEFGLAHILDGLEATARNRVG